MGLSEAAVRRLRAYLGRRLSASISVDYSAQIPSAAVGDVSIVSDSLDVQTEVEFAIQNAEKASGISYGVTVDVPSITALTNDLGSRWAAAVPPTVVSNSSTMRATSTTLENDLQAGLMGASARKSPALWAMFVGPIVMAYMAVDSA